ncbi:MAG: TldD/PmbA family protein [Candidatus Thorarchaeota archaeon]
MIDKDLLEKILTYGNKLGTKYIEIRALESKNRSLFSQQGNLVSAGENTDSGVGIRVIKDGSMGFYSCDKISKANLQLALEKSIKFAGLTKRKHSLSMGEPVISKARWEVPVKENLFDVDFDTFLDFNKDFSQALTNIEKPNLLSTNVAFLSVKQSNKIILTNEGTDLESIHSDISGFALITAKATGGSEQRFHDFRGSGGWEFFKERNFFEELSKDSDQLTKIADKAESVKFSQPIDMIVGSEVAGIISHENVGHPAEGDRIMGREAAQAGESFWKQYINNIGNQIVGSEHVSVSDDPTIIGSPGYYLYDDEGVPARKRNLMINGKLNEPLLNRDYGERFGLKSNAAARADGYAREPIIRMASTFIEPGDYTLEEMVSDIKKGIYMKSFTEWNIDDVRFQSKFVGLECYLIENGNITEKRIKRPALETTSLGLFHSIDACGKPNTIEWTHAGSCGKGDPMQLAPVFMTGPCLRLRDIRLG